MAVIEHKSKENIDIEEALGVIWTSIQKGEDNFDTVAKKVREGVEPDIIEKLLAEEYIKKSFSKIKLTVKGEDLGKQLTRRHRLTERLLADVLDFNRSLIEQVACNIEHNLSSDLADSICTLLGHPKQCPHGNPIPEGDCCKKALDKIEAIVEPLSRLDVGEDATLSYIVTSGDEYMHKLLSLGLVPGAKISLNKKEPTFVIKIGETQIAISKEIADFIYVRR
ncbi:MAG: metal-dependent transcriptional regulator [Elusimicrobia bacterium]|nr:metal-dependent transcriptional regulator [Elusimicrobiota bacterium]